jgi:hypothetical protein
LHFVKVLGVHRPLEEGGRRYGVLQDGKVVYELRDERVLLAHDNHHVLRVTGESTPWHLRDSIPVGVVEALFVMELAQRFWQLRLDFLVVPAIANVSPLPFLLDMVYHIVIVGVALDV